MKAVKLLFLAASALCLTRFSSFGPKGHHGKGFGHKKPKKNFGFGHKKMFGGKPHHHNKFPFPKPQEETPKEEIRQQLNDLLEPKYEFLLEMREKMQNEGLTEDELRGVIAAVPELQFLDSYVDDLMKKQDDGKLQFNNLQEKQDELVE